MSIRLMTVVWDTPWPSQSALLIALKLADHAHDDGTSIYPSRSKLAKHAHTSLATVKRVLAAFKLVGLLEVEKKGGKKPGDTTRYNMNLTLLMKLHDGYLKLEKDDRERMKLVESEPEQAVDETGLTVSHRQVGRGSSDVGWGSGCVGRGSGFEPQTINLKTSSRTLGEKSDFEVKKPTAAIPLKASDVSWSAWLQHLRDIGRTDLAEQAFAVGSMTVAARWPKADTPLPAVPRPAVLTPRSLAMTGEGL